MVFDEMGTEPESDLTSQLTTHPEYVALTSGLRPLPDDVLRRLVLADWLDERETEESAEMAARIRGECRAWTETVPALLAAEWTIKLIPRLQHVTVRFGYEEELASQYLDSRATVVGSFPGISWLVGKRIGPVFGEGGGITAPAVLIDAAEGTLGDNVKVSGRVVGHVTYDYHKRLAYMAKNISHWSVLGPK